MLQCTTVGLNEQSSSSMGWGPLNTIKVELSKLKPKRNSDVVLAEMILGITLFSLIGQGVNPTYN